MNLDLYLYLNILGLFAGIKESEHTNETEGVSNFLEKNQLHNCQSSCEEFNIEPENEDVEGWDLNIFVIETKVLLN